MEVMAKVWTLQCTHSHVTPGFQLHSVHQKNQMGTYKVIIVSRSSGKENLLEVYTCIQTRVPTMNYHNNYDGDEYHGNHHKHYHT